MLGWSVHKKNYNLAACFVMLFSEQDLARELFCSSAAIYEIMSQLCQTVWSYDVCKQSTLYEADSSFTTDTSLEWLCI